MTSSEEQKSKEIENIVDKHLIELIQELEKNTVGNAARAFGLYVLREKTAILFREYAPADIQAKVAEIEFSGIKVATTGVHGKTDRKNLH